MEKKVQLLGSTKTGAQRGRKLTQLLHLQFLAGQSGKAFTQVAFYQRSNSPLLIEDETFNDSDIINKLIDYEDRQASDSLRTDKI
ncbi:hypothetical protein TNCV_3290901 [Trichonephila clavipes]|nr:hypothetical protein TNCV_3290901 [Trichonephila clavipes]